MGWALLSWFGAWLLVYGVGGTWKESYCPYRGISCRKWGIGKMILLEHMGFLIYARTVIKNNPQKPYDFQGFRLGGANVEPITSSLRVMCSTE